MSQVGNILIITLSKLRAYLSSGEYKADLGFVHIIEYPEYITVNTECI